MNGFKTELVDKTLSFCSHLSLYPTTEPFEEDLNVLHSIEQLSRVKSVIPVREGQGLLSFKGATAGVLIRSIPQTKLEQRDALTNKNLIGSLEGFNSQGKNIGLGARLASRLRVRVGDSISLTIPNGAITPFGQMPRIDTFKVHFIYESGVLDFDSGVCFLPYDAANLFLDKKNKIDFIEIFMEDAYDVPRLMPRLPNIVGKPFRAVSWAEANKRFFDVVETERNIMFLILTLIVLIASFNIISGLIILIKDKTVTISILKSFGATQTEIMRLFSFVGIIIGGLGTFLGVGLGLFVGQHLEPIRRFIQMVTGRQIFDQEFYFLSQLPVDMNPTQIIIIATMSILFSYLASLYPAWRAARLHPIDGLRYE